MEKKIDIEAPPSNWGELNGRQLKCIYKMQGMGYSLTEFKLRVFLMLSGLRIRKRASMREDGTFEYYFRRTGLLPRLRRERIRMLSWEVDYWIRRHVSFLEEPVHIVRLPFEKTHVFGKRFKAPEFRMTDITYEQFANAQQYLLAYWDIQQLCESMLNNGATRNAVRKMRKSAVDARAGFLAHLYTSATFQLTDSRHNGTRLSMHRVYNYDSERAERNKWIFRYAGRYLFDLTVWYFQSCLKEYSDDFPDLFREKSGDSDRSEIAMQVGTINAVQKYAGYTSQQDVNDSNAIFVFDILNTMQHEAKEIERINKKR